MVSRRSKVVASVMATVAVGALIGFGACRNDRPVGVGLTMIAPQGVLDDATSVTVRVFPAEGHECGADGGVGEVPEESLSFDLSKTGCEGGATWCGEITLDEDGTEQMFFVEVADSAGPLAQGCGTAVIDQDPVEVDITVVRFVEPACCGDGIVQSTEQCDGGGDESCGGTADDFACNTDCTTKLLWVDDDLIGPPTALGQGAVTMAFTPGEGALDGGLRLAWNWSEDQPDIGLRFLSSNLATIEEPATLAKAHRVYFRCTGTDQPAARDQISPSIAPQGSGAVVAFMSTEDTPLRFDAVVIALNSDGCSDMLSDVVLSNQTSSVDAIDVATGPGDVALVVWQQNGKVFGRTFDGTTAGAETITIADDGAAPRVAGSSEGWVVAFQGPGGGDTDGVLIRRIDSGLSLGAPILVNSETSGAQDQPDVAMANDGSVAVVFRSGDDVFLQRFSSSDAPTDEDRAGPIHADTEGAQGTPAIAVSPSGDFFVAAWVSGNTIRARFAGRSTGFLPNNVSGQPEDFLASDDAGQAKRPAVAAGEFVAIGWDDQGGPIPGIVVRRFPLPQ